MNLKTILDKYTDDEIIAKLTEKANIVSEIDKYFDVLSYLRGLEVKSNKLYLLIVPQRDYSIPEDSVEEETHYVEVFGYDFECNEKFAIDFVPWCEWLGMKIVEGSLKVFNTLDILVYSIFSMTELGLTEEKIKKEKDILYEISENITNGIEQTYTMEEVIAHMNEKFGFEYCPPSEEEQEKRSIYISEVLKENEEIVKKFIMGSI